MSADPIEEALQKIEERHQKDELGRLPICVCTDVWSLVAAVRAARSYVDRVAEADAAILRALGRGEE